MNKSELKFNVDEKMRRVIDREQVKDLISKHCLYQCNCMRKEELADLWVHTPAYTASASLANNYGYFIGMDEIYKYYVNDFERLQAERLSEYPEIEQNFTNFGHGFMETHTVSTPIVYLAGDGKTARFLGYDQGQQSVGKGDGTARVLFTFGNIFADCVKEDGEWRIWHLILERDHTVNADEVYSVPAHRPFGDDPLDAEAGNPTFPCDVYDNFYGWADLYKKMPKEYYSYSDAESYGPNGKHHTYNEFPYTDYNE